MILTADNLIAGAEQEDTVSMKNLQKGLSTTVLHMLSQLESRQTHSHLLNICTWSQYFHVLKPSHGFKSTLSTSEENLNYSSYVSGSLDLKSYVSPSSKSGRHPLEDLIRRPDQLWDLSTAQSLTPRLYTSSQAVFIQLYELL
ncbi:hypothetical protein F511_30514 [Dorcoceras hygrometricum]|uniref:Uncharacterized protein n=1 Tax=Dorcoceras hygrometricum TaxID=472368 RepID=A0A2Z7AH86_9LAMI|nr:hypothetical protein F511_30514 [Dorcoceras hygrometricum]